MQHKIDFALMSGPLAAEERLCQGLFAFSSEAWGCRWGKGGGGGQGGEGRGNGEGEGARGVSRSLQVSWSIGIFTPLYC